MMSKGHLSVLAINIPHIHVIDMVWLYGYRVSVSMCINKFPNSALNSHEISSLALRSSRCLFPLDPNALSNHVSVKSEQ